MKNISVYLTGFLMAISDSMPGISGGTIAYILGQYENLINAIYNLKDSSKIKESLSYLIKLGSAWIIGLFVATLAISSFVDGHIYEMSSLFLGFVFISIPITLKQEKNKIQFKSSYLIYTIIAATIVIIISTLGSNNDTIINIKSFSSLSSYLYLMLVGAIALSTMLLPGISGSTVLLIFGVYFVVIDSVHKFFTFDFSGIMVLISFAIGALIGALLFVKTIKVLFSNFHSQTIFFIQGLLLGSLYSIILSPTFLGNTRLSLESFNLIYFLIGVLLIYGLDKIKK